MRKTHKKGNHKETLIYLLPMSVFILLTTIYAVVYKIMVVFNNDSFVGLDQSSHAINFLYYSITTASTTGYGDIYPITSAGRLVAASEVILGPLLLLGSIVYVAVRSKRNLRRYE